MRSTFPFSVKFLYVFIRIGHEHFIFLDFAIILIFLFKVLQVEVITYERIVVLAILTSRDH